MALRNSIAVAIPLAVGIEMGNALAAVGIAIGALNVAYSDGRDPYPQRARRMLLWSVLSGVAVLSGSLAGQFQLASVLFAAAWAFVAGMMISVSTRAGDLGLNTLVSVVVFAAKGSTTSQGAIDSGLLVCAGGVLQTIMALLFWPVRRNKPQMRAIGKAYRDLASEVDPNEDTPALAPIYSPTTDLQETLSALGTDYSLEGERLRLLFDQTDRLRLSIYLIKRLRDELGEGDSQRSELEGDAAEDLDHFLIAASKLLKAVGDVLATGSNAEQFDALRKLLIELLERAQLRKRDSQLRLGEQIASALDVVTGQLRIVAQLATNTTDEGERHFLKVFNAMPWKLQATNWLATMQANLTWKSAIFRHGIRLSVCVAVADLIEHFVSWQRAYWIPMTVAVILKPDFATTFSRGGLRLAGTIFGLILATLLYMALPQSGWTQLVLVGVYTYFLRYLGPANYGVFTIAISGLIVFLLAAAGTPPADVVWTRGVSTLAGGLLALVGYAIWPTWERATIRDSLASMIEAARSYFRAVADQFSSPREPDQTLLDERRTDWRLKRKDAEAAVDRVASEPGNNRSKTNCLTSIMASSHGFIYSVMGLEGGLAQSVMRNPPDAFKKFANDVDLTMYVLETALKGSKFASSQFPQLREDHRRIIEARNALSPVGEFLVLETDRLTVSLNTLREQVARYLEP